MEKLKVLSDITEVSLIVCAALSTSEEVLTTLQDKAELEATLYGDAVNHEAGEASMLIAMTFAKLVEVWKTEAFHTMNQLKPAFEKLKTGPTPPPGVVV